MKVLKTDFYKKDIIKNSNNVNSFKVSNLTAEEAYVKIRIINENKFMAELENNLNIKKNNNLWNITKYY